MRNLQRQNAFVLLVFLVTETTFAGSADVTGLIFDSDVADNLYQLNLNSGEAELIGNVGIYSDLEGLAFDEDGTLYGAADTTDELVRVDPATGAGTLVGGFGVQPPARGLALAFDCSGRLWMASQQTDQLYEVDPESGAATLVGSFLAGDEISGLAFHPQTDKLYGVGNTLGVLYVIDRDTGAAEAVGFGMGVAIESNQGLDVDGSGTLWGLSDNNGLIYTVDPLTGIGTAVANADIVEAESLAIGPPPCALFRDSFEPQPSP